MAYQSVTAGFRAFHRKTYTQSTTMNTRMIFTFHGERHNFWEFQCVDKGSAEIVTDNGSHILNRRSGYLSPAK